MIIAAVTGLVTLFMLIFGGGAGSEEVFQEAFSSARGAVIDVVKDKERRKVVKAVLDQRKEPLEAADKLVAKRRIELWQVDARYEATMADYQRVVGQLDDAWVDGFDTLVELRGAVVEHLTADEWQVLQTRWGKKEGKKHPLHAATPGKKKDKGKGEPAVEQQRDQT